ncbi:DUF86 domain-containing protein [Methylobacterium sp. E-065]|uniref:HepT-like ribonuclease domain-containing protein n=1 Tax=Methylobacterium sp. E-065 TaxID=2836583 RepID=UPI001FB87C68|nr:HepT-like ribonuclease domain-containing protein [Methylobacterium sp. E-065]MCJ2020382.1 DUF86 domain-containing protein [Methylobacterium sp. E-065]
MPFQPSERARDACEDIITNAQAAESFVAGLSYEAFVADRRTNYAVVRCREIISEASRRLTGEMRDRHPNVPWRDIADAGNVYRHGYHRVMLDNVWRTVHERLTDLVAACRAELDRVPES